VAVRVLPVFEAVVGPMGPLAEPMQPVERLGLVLARAWALNFR